MRIRDVDLFLLMFDKFGTAEGGHGMAARTLILCCSGFGSGGGIGVAYGGSVGSVGR